MKRRPTKRERDVARVASILGTLDAELLSVFAASMLVQMVGAENALAQATDFVVEIDEIRKEFPLDTDTLRSLSKARIAGEGS